MNVFNLKAYMQALETLAILALFFLVLTAVTHVFVFIYISIGLLVIGLFIRPLAGKITQGWLAVAKMIGAFNSRIILTLVFYLVLTPIAVIFRFFNKDALGVVRVKSAASCFSVRDHTFTKEDLENMW